MVCSGVPSTTMYSYGNGLCICDVFQCASCTLNSGQGDMILQFNFIAVFKRVNHLGIFNKLCSVGIRGSVLTVLTAFI